MLQTEVLEVLKMYFMFGNISPKIVTFMR